MREANKKKNLQRLDVSPSLHVSLFTITKQANRKRSPPRGYLI